MLSHYQAFKELHHAQELFVLPNAWNAQSAITLQQQGFPAIATSSAAVAKSLGYEDGEKMPFPDYLFIIKRIVSSINLPFSVDLETGYATTAEGVYANIARLAEMGVAGINLEDSQIDASKRELQDAESFAGRLSDIKNRLIAKNVNVFINVRCDTYLLNVGNKQEETVLRAKRYESAGADGLFLPCIVNEQDIRTAVAATRLPLNVMAIPGLPGFGILNQSGVKRVSLGGFLFDKIYKNVTLLAGKIVNDKNVSVLFN